MNALEAMRTLNVCNGWEADVRLVCFGHLEAANLLVSGSGLRAEKRVRRKRPCFVT